MKGRNPAPVLSAVVFDFDGVLADTEPLHLRVYQDLFSDLGIELTAEEYAERYLGFDDVGVFRTVSADYGLDLDAEQVAALIRMKAERFADMAARSDLLFPGAAECVRRFAAEVPLAIASGALPDEIDLILRQAGLRDAFAVVVGATADIRSKPAPDSYLRALALLRQQRGATSSHASSHADEGRPRERTGDQNPGGCAVAIEDSRWGIQAAQQAGLRCVAVTTTYPAEALGTADLIVPSLIGLDLSRLRHLCDAGVRSRFLGSIPTNDQDLIP